MKTLDILYMTTNKMTSIVYVRNEQLRRLYTAEQVGRSVLHAAGVAEQSVAQSNRRYIKFQTRVESWRKARACDLEVTISSSDRESGRCTHDHYRVGAVAPPSHSVL